ncbi:hypothetical protein EYF80_029105 [Liparis tanakae]|uniref:Uncharacterized protein n=1 Tax=Liparis tanakae TaxID=230148 RepID=A0A4Z2H731_9TELE|nr:hypothetical protein EYF80_029105 [Liparis tanakae]
MPRGHVNVQLNAPSGHFQLRNYDGAPEAAPLQCGQRDISSGLPLRDVIGHVSPVCKWRMQLNAKLTCRDL